MALHLKSMELPSVPMQLDIVRHLRLDINAMRKFQELTGKDIMKVFPLPAKGPDGKVLPPEQQPPINIDWNGLCAAVWAALVWEDPTLTLDEVGTLMTIAPLEDFTAKLLESFNVAMPHIKRAEGKEADPLGKRMTEHLTQAPPGGDSSSSASSG